MKYAIVSIVLSLFLIGCADDDGKTSDDGKLSPEKSSWPIEGPVDGISMLFEDPNLATCVRNTDIGYDKKKNEWIYVDSNEDGELSQTELNQVKSLNCPGLGIKKLTGIEKFKNLEYFNCSANNIGHLPNLSAMPNLKVLRCVNNDLGASNCDELAALKAKGLDILEIEKQRDGRKLTCDKAKLLGKIPTVQTKSVNGKVRNNPLNDVWGFKHKRQEYVVYGDFTHIYIIEVYKKAPYYKKVATLHRGTANALASSQPNHSIWGEYRYYTKKGKAYLYASSEGNWKTKDPYPVLQIFDVTDMNNIKEIKLDKPHPGLRSIHNITLDKKTGHLIAFGGTQHEGKKDKNGRLPAWAGARYYSLENPEKPKYVTTVGKYYVHDGQVVTKKVAGKLVSKLYLAHGSSAIHWDANRTTNKENRFTVYDVTDLKNVKVTHDQQYPFGYCHNIWVTEDETHVVVTGETSVDNQVSLWELKKNKKGKGFAEFRNGLNLQGGALAHNAFIQKNLVYMSHYTKGVQIAEIFTNAQGQKNMRFKWSYDTYPENNLGLMDGSWGVYPFSKTGLFFVTDSESGLYIFKKLPKLFKPMKD